VVSVTLQLLIPRDAISINDLGTCCNACGFRADDLRRIISLSKAAEFYDYRFPICQSTKDCGISDKERPVS
jgi:hypothetical protein